MVISFIAFFYLIEYKENQFDNLTKYLVLTENAISKYNPNGIGFAKVDQDIKTVLQNTLEDPKVIEPIKRIEIFDKDTLLFDSGGVSCKKEIKISRLVIYNDKISKAIFTFCE